MLVEYKKVDVSLIAKQHGVSAHDLQTCINWYWANENMPRTIEKRKNYQVIEKLLDKLLLAYENVENLPAADAALALKQDTIMHLECLPNAKKGPDRSNRDTLMQQLAYMYPGSTALSRDSNNHPAGPFFLFCRDVFKVAHEHTTPESIADMVKKINK